MIVDPNNFGVWSNGFRFGVDKAGLSGELRKLADAIEDGHIVPQSIDVTSETKIDDYLMYSLTFVWAECEDPLKVKAANPVDIKSTGKIKEIFGPNNPNVSPIPLDVRKV